MQFAKNLRELRAKHKLSQEELAHKIGVSRQMVARYESGENYPELDKVITIAKALDCKIDDLVNQADAKNKADPFQMPTEIKVKIEKPKLSMREKVIQSIAWCVASLLIFSAVAILLTEFGGTWPAVAMMLCLASWALIILYYFGRA
jgi:transcriptional regulator with XRE-family HTH domain